MAQTSNPVRAAVPGTNCYLRLTHDSLHNLAAPLNQIRVMTELIAKKRTNTLDADTKKLVGLLLDSSVRLQNLFEGLQSYWQAVGTPPSYQMVQADAILTEALSAIQGLIERSGAVVIREPLPEIYCDPQRITCAFRALLDNSIKFAGPAPPRIRVSATARDDAWLFSVEDGGIGIDPRHHERLFSAFQRFHAYAYPGAGVGLAITRQIVEDHGGRIWVESQIDAGATFFFTLPWSRPAADG